MYVETILTLTIFFHIPKHVFIYTSNAGYKQLIILIAALCFFCDKYFNTFCLTSLKYFLISLIFLSGIASLKYCK